MTDGFWDAPLPLDPSAPAAKRSRCEYEHPHGPPSGRESLYYHAGPQVFGDMRSTGTPFVDIQLYPLDSEYNGYYGGSGFGRGTGGETPDHARVTNRLMYEASGMMGGPHLRAAHPDILAHDCKMGYDNVLHVDPLVRPGLPANEMTLPPDASSTLFVEGLPHDSTEREVAHIFRPFIGYKEVRVVRKVPRYRSVGPVVLGFIDFEDAACAVRAFNALQGYKMDEWDCDSPFLRLHYSRFGPKSAYGSRGKR